MSILSTYLAREGLTQRQFAAKIGVDQSIVSRLTKSVDRGGMKPSLALAVRIERATNGDIPVASWIDSDLKKAS